jgi:fructose-bisphosphate aldolase class 1
LEVGRFGMNAPHLAQVARALVADGKGLLAMDESNGTCNRRFAAAGIPQTEEARRAYRELIISTPGLGESISGTILYDGTIRQMKKDGTPFVDVIVDAGIIPGIKVDIGAKDLAGHPGEKVTEGLDGLRERLNEYFQMGARFEKWRAVMRSALASPAERASRPTRRLWPAMLDCARKLGWFPSSNRKFSWMATIPWRNAAPRPKKSCITCSPSFTSNA